MAQIAQTTTMVVAIVAALLVQYTTVAVTCGQVNSIMAMCIGYARRGFAVDADCCNNVGNLGAASGSAADKRTTCNCLKLLFVGDPAVDLREKCGSQLAKFHCSI